MDETDQYQRFIKPNEGQQYESEYDISSPIIYDPIERGTQPLSVVTIDLSSAGSRQINVPGRAFVAYYFQTNTTNRARQLTGLIQVAVNQTGQNDPSQIFPAKFNRGFRGSFTQLNLSWGAQANTSVDFVVLRSKYTPWMTDDFESTVGAGNLTTDATSGLSQTGGTGATNTNVVVSLQKADATHNGYLSSGDWSTFNSKQAALTFSSPLVNTAGTVSIPAATTSVNGYLTSADWNTFNGKQNALTFRNLTAAGTDGIVITGGSGAVVGAAATSIAQTKADATHNGYLAQADFAKFTTAPLITTYSTGGSSGTHTLTGNPLYIRVRMIGAGGGGGGSSGGSGNGGNGTNTTFGTAYLIAGGGQGAAGSGSYTAGLGGTVTTDPTAKGIALNGGSGSSGSYAVGAASVYPDSGTGGAGPFGGQGGANGPLNAGISAAPNSGAGGGGGGTSIDNIGAGGGGAGAYIDALISSPAASYAYGIGTKGSGGTSSGVGSFAGGDGGDGFLEVTEFYS